MTADIYGHLFPSGRRRCWAGGGRKVAIGI